MDKLKNAVSALFGLRRGFFCDGRTLILLLPALLVLAFDLPVMWTLIYSLSAIFVIVAAAHIIRRVLFHYVDLEPTFDRATESPMGAGIAFLGVCVLVSSIVVAAAVWIGQ